MRYTRMEIPKYSNAPLYRLILEFFIIIPIIATIFGGLLTRILIIPYFNNNISSGSSTGTMVSKPVIVGKEYRVSILQAGVYLNKNNADNLVKSMISKGQNAFYAQDGDSFRIILDISEDRKMLEEKKTTLMTSGYQCIINDYNIYTKNQYGQDNKSIDSYRYEIAGLLKQEFQYRQALTEGKEFNLEQLKNSISSIIAEYDKIKESGIAKDKIQEVAKYHTEILKIGNEIIANKDLQEILPRLASQAIIIDKLSNVNFN